GVTFATALAVTAIARRLNGPAPTLEGAKDAAAVIEAAAAELAVAERPADEAAIRALRDAARALRALARPSDLSDARRVGAALAAPGSARAAARPPEPWRASSISTAGAPARSAGPRRTTRNTPQGCCR